MESVKGVYGKGREYVQRPKRNMWAKWQLMTLESFLTWPSGQRTEGMMPFLPSPWWIRFFNLSPVPND